MFLPSSALLQGPKTLAASTCWLLPIPQPELRYLPRLPREIGTGFWAKQSQKTGRASSGLVPALPTMPGSSRSPPEAPGAAQEPGTSALSPSRLASPHRVAEGSAAYCALQTGAVGFAGM